MLKEVGSEGKIFGPEGASRERKSQVEVSQRGNSSGEKVESVAEVICSRQSGRGE